MALALPMMNWAASLLYDGGILLVTRVGFLMQPKLESLLSSLDAEQDRLRELLCEAQPLLVERSNILLFTGVEPERALRVRQLARQISDVLEGE